MEGVDRFIIEGLYLRSEVNEKTGDIDMDCGLEMLTNYVPTNFNDEQIVAQMNETYRVSHSKSI